MRSDIGMRNWSQLVRRMRNVMTAMAVAVVVVSCSGSNTPTGPTTPPVTPPPPTSTTNPTPPAPTNPAPPATTPAPPPANGTVSMRWMLTDACADGVGLQARFFDKTNALVWPADSTKVYFTEAGGAIDVSLAARPGASVCYGAQPDSTNGRYWGIGIGGTNGCADCCYTGAATTVRLNLTC